MKKQHKVYLLALLLLLVFGGIVVAQSSTNFRITRFTVAGGGSTQSTSYIVTSVIGQPATDVATSSSYRGSAGFLREENIGYRTWLPFIDN